MKISNETKVGILATFAIVIVILGVNFLKGKNVFSKNVILYAKYTDAQSLQTSNPVMMHGFQIGQVDELQLIREARQGDSLHVLVKFHIYGGIEVPKNSVAKIISSDLLGSKALEILPGDITKIPGTEKMVVRNDTLVGHVEVSLTESVNKVVAPVKEKVEKLISSVDTIMTTLNEVFNDNTAEGLRMTFASAEGSAANIEAMTKDLDNFVKDGTVRARAIMMDVEKIAENLKNNNAAITRAIDNFASVSDSLRAADIKAILAQAQDAMAKVNEVVTDIKNGNGSLGKLLNDDKLYANLNNASKNLDKLVIDIKNNPSRYLSFPLIQFNRNQKDTAN